jgi:uncharacterized ParB-like nuclease family protein
MRVLKAIVRTVNPNFFAQHEMDVAKVRLMERELLTGKSFPRPVLVDYGGSYMPLDGHHRMAAHERLGRELEAWVVPGRAFDALCIRVDDAEAHVMCDGVAAMHVAAFEVATN